LVVAVWAEVVALVALVEMQLHQLLAVLYHHLGHLDQNQYPLD
jgi:hypothetical protein